VFDWGVSVMRSMTCVLQGVCEEGVVVSGRGYVERGGLCVGAHGYRHEYG